MWAGGRVEFIAPLTVGAEAHRLSTIMHIEEKHGRTGALLFVTVRHDYSQHGQLCVREEQDIVYREPNPPKLDSAPADAPADWSEAVTPTPTLLFRYSAVTFNGHRIHYDFPYVTETEGYAGLVVHGPMIATLNLRAFIRANPGKRVRHFAYRGVRPLTVPTLRSGRAHQRTRPGPAVGRQCGRRGAERRRAFRLIPDREHPMHTYDSDDLNAIREGVRALCAEFDASYWRKIDEEKGFPRPSSGP